MAMDDNNDGTLSVPWDLVLGEAGDMKRKGMNIE